jgi:hypothetical protein
MGFFIYLSCLIQVVGSHVAVSFRGNKDIVGFREPNSTEKEQDYQMEQMTMDK